MHPQDRLHALDAVRAFALLSGIALHAAQPFIPGISWLTAEAPSNTLAGVFFAIHMFRMPLFFLIAGFFGRMMIKRCGMPGFIKDRARRILVPLVVGVPVITLLTGVAYVVGAIAAGTDPRSLQGLKPPSSPVHHDTLASVNLIHLWFLYYLLIFYATALIVSFLFARHSRTREVVDAGVRFVMRGPLGALLLALPIAVYYCQLKGWSPWGGLPAPMSLIPDLGAVVAYGLFFNFGWLLHRQQGLLQSLVNRWPQYALLAIAAWLVCRTIGGSAPHWGPFLKNGDLAMYTASYMVGAWCWSFLLIGVAMRFLSNYSPVRRYLADSSYWLYLMHIPVLLFFDQILHPLAWHWSVEYPVSIAGAVLVLLLSYHYLVRFTFIGLTLNGHRQPRATRQSPRPAIAG